MKLLRELFPTFHDLFKAHRRKLAIATAFLGVVVVCVVAYRYCERDWKAIQGEWETVSVEGSGFSGDWRFSTNGYVDHGMRSHYSVYPLIRTITWSDGGYGTYELSGDGKSLKIWQNNGDKSPIVYTLKKVKSYDY